MATAQATVLESPLPAAGGPARDPYRWTRAAYHRLAETGFLGPEDRVELIEGEILLMPVQERPHTLALLRVQAALQRVVAGRPFHVVYQLPVGLTEFSEPEPDVAVIPGSFEDYEEDHPTTAALLVEVSDSTLLYDRSVKASLYARANIPEYWVVDLVNHRLEVRREPERMPGEAYGHGYATIRILRSEQTVACPVAADQPIRVADLLPPRRKEKKR